MADYQRKPSKFIAKGVSLRYPPDLMPDGLYPVLTNVQPRILGGMEPRAGIENQGAALLPDGIHSIRRLNDPTDTTFAIFMGAGSSVYDTTSAVAIVSGFSGKPLSMVPFRPNQTPRPWMYVSDDTKSQKIRTDRTSFEQGIAAPLTPPITIQDTPIYRSDVTFDNPAIWVPGGTAGATSAFSRFNTTIDTIVYYNIVGTAGTGWCSIVPTVVDQNFQPGCLFLINGAETCRIDEVFEPIVDTTISGIMFDAGATGGCCITLTDQSTGLRPNALVVLDAGGANEETVRVESVTFGPSQTASFRCTTGNTHIAGEVVEGTMSFRTYTVGAFSAGQTLVDDATQTTIATGTGYIDLTQNINYASIFTHPTNQDDYVHISLRIDNPALLTEGRIVFDIDQATNDFAHNALYKPFRASDVQPNVDGDDTAQEAGKTALEQVTIDKKVFSLLTQEQKNALLQIRSQQPGGQLAPAIGGLTGSIQSPITISGTQATELGISQQALTDAINRKVFFGGDSQRAQALQSVNSAFSGLDANADNFPISSQVAPGQTQWTELLFRIGDLTRIGSDPSVSLAQIKAVRIQLEVTASVTVVCDSLWVGGTYGPDNPTTAEYLYASRFRSSETGVISNAGPPVRSGLRAFREGLVAVGEISADAQVDLVDIFRFGGSNPGWKYVGSHANLAGAFLLDTQTDADIQLNETLAFNNFKPFPIADLPRVGTCNVVGTSVDWVSGDNFDTRWAPGSEIIITGQPFALYASPSSPTRLELTQNAGTQTGATFMIPDATIAATTMPAMWGPDPITGVMFACGDGSGNLYWTNPQDPDSASDANVYEVTSPSEELMNGFMWNGVSYVWSTERLFRVVASNTPGQYITQEVPNAEGLFGRYAFCVGPDRFWWVSRHGVQESGGAGSVSLTDESLYPLFPHDGQDGTNTNGYTALDTADTDTIRLFYTRDSLYLTFLGSTGPVIETVCPLPDGFTDEEYSEQITVVGGTSPLLFEIIAGALPNGITLNSTNGVLNGTPTETGEFTVTIRVTDAVGLQDTLTNCSLSIFPISVCSTLEDTIYARWTHNTRLGPFQSDVDGEIYFIGQDPADLKNLIVVKSASYGDHDWAIVGTFTPLANDVASHDIHQVGTLLHVSTQENSTERVAYHCFDMSTDTWTTLNVQVVASATGNSPCCGITVLSNGDIGLMYETDPENVGGTDYGRTGYRYSTDDGATWSAEITLGATGVAIDTNPSRPVADSAGRVQVFMGNESLAVFFGEYWIQTVLADHTVNTATRWAGGSALSQIQNHRMGDYCTFESGGVTQIVFLGRMLFTGRYTIFATSDNMTAPYQPADVRDGVVGTTFNGLGGATYEAAYPQVSAFFDGANIHFMGNSFSNSTPTWLYHKQAASPYAPADLLPTGDADQSGPNYTTFIPGQEMAARILEFGGNLYYCSVRDAEQGGLGLVYNLILLSELPTSSAFTISDWETECV